MESYNSAEHSPMTDSRVMPQSAVYQFRYLQTILELWLALGRDVAAGDLLTLLTKKMKLSDFIWLKAKMYLIWKWELPWLMSYVEGNTWMGRIYKKLKVLTKTENPQPKHWNQIYSAREIISSAATKPDVSS